jgi:hypothetical protein
VIEETVVLILRRTTDDHAELHRLEAEFRRRRADLPRPIVMTWSETSVVTLDRGSAWLVGPAECDPLRDEKGRTPIPRSARARLQELAAAGLPFHRVALAHQLDPTGPVRELLPTLRQGPVACSEATARLLVGPPPPHPAVGRAARVLDMLVGGASVAAIRFADDVVDPIVFGVVGRRPPRAGDATLWFPLAAWRW